MILDKIVEDKKIRLVEHKKSTSYKEVRYEAERVLREGDGNRDDCFYQALAKDGISVIAEFKKASPSAGDINEGVDLDERIRSYSNSADAISCLTEEDYFKGNIDYLRYIRSRTATPIIRKDFMIDEYQFYEAKAIGADAILLICAILDDVMLKDFYQLSRELKLDALVECHDITEVERTLKINPRILGINNRNLNDFSVDLNTTKELNAYIPKDKVVVAESGIKTIDDVRFLKETGVDAFLIGQTLMETDDPHKLIGEFKECK